MDFNLKRHLQSVDKFDQFFSTPFFRIYANIKVTIYILITGTTNVGKVCDNHPSMKN